MQAAAALQQRVPGVNAEPDPVVGAPRLITSSEGFLTGPGGVGGAISPETLNAIPAGDPHRVFKAFLNEHAALFGHNADVLADARVTRDYVTAHNGLRTVVLEQTFQGVPVFAGLLQGHITAAGELVRLSSQFVADTAAAAANGSPQWSSLLANPPVIAAMALTKAAGNLGLEIDSASVASAGAVEALPNVRRLTAPGVRGEAYANLVWLPLGRSSMRLCWSVILAAKPRAETYRILVDAEIGEVLLRHSLTRYQAAPQRANYRVYTSDSPSPFSPGWPTPNTQQPSTVARTLLTGLTNLSATGSPSGWLDPAVGGMFQTTGNNVDAHTDRDDDDLPDLPRPVSTANPANFDFPLNLTLAPASYTNAAVVNLFYWNNFLHDRFYDLGFTEAAGNYQNNNFGRGGYGADAVQADAQDGMDLNDQFHVNNANFSAVPDGIPGRMQMYIFDGPQPDRDGDLDSEIMCHEGTHGLTERLVGGGTLIYELQPAQMGEGWSDWYALTLLSEAADDPDGCYAAGGYASYLIYGLADNYYYGIRRYPYSTDMAKNPLTFKDIDPNQADPHFGIPVSPIFSGSPADEVHAAGEVWCVTLWEMRANLVNAFGWAEGNQTALQLVTDALKLCPPNPTWLESRDAIIQADEIANGGANRAEIWLAFAKRGMGLSARCPTADTSIGVVEAFDVPDDVIVRPPDGILEVYLIPPADSTLFGGAASSIFVRVRDGRAVTNATVRGKLNGVTDLTFRNDGVSPDARRNDSIYSTRINVPSTVTNLILSLTITAPGKADATLTANYFVATVPANDFFASAAKVKAQGDSFVSNNKFATLEPSEPIHAGVANMGNTLWWDFVPTNSARVLVDTAGSSFRTLVAVYTGNTLQTLKEVKSVSSVPTRKQSYLFFDAVRATNYHIVVGSVSTNNAGFVRLRIAPDGNPDITPPVASILKPFSGRIFTNNIIDLLASAYDPQPEASGVDKFIIRVGPRPLEPMILAAGLTDSSNRISLVEGRNNITVQATDVAGNTSEPVTVTVTYRRMEPSNDHFAYARILSGQAGTNSVPNALATKEPGEPRHAGNDGGHSVWWKWQAPGDGSLLLSTENSTFDTLMGLYLGNRVDSLTTVASNDDAYDGVKWSKLRHAVRSNVVYSIAVDGFSGATGTVQLAYSFVATNVLSLNVSQTTGGMVFPGTGLLDVEANSSITLTAVPDDGYDFARWDGDVATVQNPFSVLMTRNLAVKAVFRNREFSDDFESGGLNALGWTSGGDKGWFVTNTTTSSGKFAARSGLIGNSQTSSLILTARFREGLGTFDYRVSCEQPWDYLGFYLDGVLVQQWSGDVLWTTHEVNLTAGEHTLEWRYTKDPANSVGLDAAFIDNVDLPLDVPVNNTTAALLSLERLREGGIRLNLRGQTNQFYVIQATPDFPAHWRSLLTNQARYGEIHYTDPDSTTQTQRFYRAIVK